MSYTLTQGSKVLIKVCDRRASDTTGGRILERNWDKSLKSFPSCYSQSPLLTDFTSPPLEQSDLKPVCKVNIVHGNLKPENSGDLSRRLQPGYNYVGQTNARQPLHIKCCGQVAWIPINLSTYQNYAQKPVLRIRIVRKTLIPTA